MTKKELLFPSPYGVSFILIMKNYLFNTTIITKFPSPYGVSFVLTKSRTN